MPNFKTRVEGLMSATTSDQALKACKEALQRYSEYTVFNVPANLLEQYETSISETLIKELDSIDEASVAEFLNIERRIHGMNNLGVKKALDTLRESELAKTPSTMYMLDSLLKLRELPEWRSINTVIEKLSSFEWHADIKKQIDELRSNASKYSEDIKIYNAVHEAKSSRSSFVISALEKDIEAYLNIRTATNRAKLIESLSKHNYDPFIKNLYNTVLESEKTFQLKENSNDAFVKKVYSPVIITEKDEIFAVHGKAFVKHKENIRPLTEEEYAKLPGYFTFLSSFLSSNIVEIKENLIKVFANDKKIEILEESDDVKVSINGKKVSKSDFHNIFLKAGVFRPDERKIIEAVSAVVDKWDIIMELDFAKSIFPKGNPHRRIDVFKVGNKMHINREDTLMKESLFYANCNATQSRNMVLEFAHFDLGNTFASVLSEEERAIRQIDEQKKILLDSIEYLNAKKSSLENHPDSELRESEEVKQIIELIEEEISTAKSEYFKLQNKAKNLTRVHEGASAGDQVEFLKKKQ